MREPNRWEIKLIRFLYGITGHEPRTEYRFHETRKWRFDAAYPQLFIAFEVEGGTWTGGRHVHPAGFAKDCEKYNEAAKMGWKVYRLTPQMITEEYLEHLLLLPSCDNQE